MTIKKLDENVIEETFTKTEKITYFKSDLLENKAELEEQLKSINDKLKLFENGTE